MHSVGLTRSAHPKTVSYLTEDSCLVEVQNWLPLRSLCIVIGI